MAFAPKKSAATVPTVSHNTVCLTGHLVATALYLIITVAAFLGVYLTHVSAESYRFGTSQGSLAIIAFVVSLSFLASSIKECWRKCDVCRK